MVVHLFVLLMGTKWKGLKPKLTVVCLPSSPADSFAKLNIQSEFSLMPKTPTVPTPIKQFPPRWAQWVEPTKQTSLTDARRWPRCWPPAWCVPALRYSSCFLHCRVMGTFSTRCIIHQAEIISIMIEFSGLSVKIPWFLPLTTWPKSSSGVSPKKGTQPTRNSYRIMPMAHQSTDFP